LSCAGRGRGNDKARRQAPKFLSSVAHHRHHPLVCSEGDGILGRYGDRIDRKAALIATLLLTGPSTFLVGCVPTYEQIGVWGAVLLVALRFI
jgi:hypothetical protein